MNGTADLNRPTTKVLPSGDKLDGKKAYEQFLSFFISTEQSPEDVIRTGQDVLDKFYPRVSKQINLVINM